MHIKFAGLLSHEQAGKKETTERQREMLASLYMGYGMVVRTCAAVASLCLCMYTDRASASGGAVGVGKRPKG